jgi:hypothetical protein
MTYDLSSLQDRSIFPVPASISHTLNCWSRDPIQKPQATSQQQQQQQQQQIAETSILDT